MNSTSSGKSDYKEWEHMEEVYTLDRSITTEGEAMLVVQSRMSK